MISSASKSIGGRSVAAASGGDQEALGGLGEVAGALRAILDAIAQIAQQVIQGVRAELEAALGGGGEGPAGGEMVDMEPDAAPAPAAGPGMADGDDDEP